MSIEFITWNIGGGKVLTDGADAQKSSSFLDDGLAHIVSTIRGTGAEIAFLQETHTSKTYSQAQEIATRLGWSNVADFPLDTSHIEPDKSIGISIISRYEIKNIRAHHLTNPNITATWEDGTTVHTHNKGVLSAKVIVKKHTLKVATLHLVPFHRFDIPLEGEVASKIFSEVEQIIEDSNVEVLAGDFNINAEDVLGFLPRLQRSGWREDDISEPTTPRGKQVDHVVYRKVCLDNERLLKKVKTDHYSIAAALLLQ
jgi:endonuclease/exonuclease/phosphatase family metal-dependent hydrolase